MVSPGELNGQVKRKAGTSPRQKWVLPMGAGSVSADPGVSHVGPTGHQARGDTATAQLRLGSPQARLGTSRKLPADNSTR